ncbi:MAG TPA: DUF4396 domain-containing protein [Gemmatimonadales bacterium]|jgi:hypothetical protein
MRSLNRLALSATTHCLTGCAIGEVLGMVLGAAFHWSNSTTIVVSVVLAFLFGYGLTLRPLLASGLGTSVVLRAGSCLRHGIHHSRWSPWWQPFP